MSPGRMQKAGLDQLHRHGGLELSSWYEQDQRELMRPGILVIALPFVFAYSRDNNIYASLERPKSHAQNRLFLALFL